LPISAWHVFVPWLGRAVFSPGFLPRRITAILLFAVCLAPKTVEKRARGGAGVCAIRWREGLHAGLGLADFVKPIAG
jgi:hypothetical protein